MALTEYECRAAKGREKIYTLSDGRGLLLEVRPTGKKYWIVRLYEGGKEKRRSLGSYPGLSLKKAREGAFALRKKGAPSKGDLFSSVVEEWFSKQVDGVLAPSYSRVLRVRADKFILPTFGKTPLNKITSGAILMLCRKIEAEGTIETAHRIRQLIGQIFRYAIATGRGETDPTVALRGALTPSKSTHYATITDTEGIRGLMRAIGGYPYPVLRAALFFSALTFVRPGEVRHAEWKEFDFEEGMWKLPAEKMKMKKPHIVPLSNQLLEILKGLKPLTGSRGWLFPSPRNDNRAMSENGVRAALRSLGYENGSMTPHGFRAMAATVLNEKGFPPDVIERQLAHSERNPVRAAYNHAEYLAERKEMMQWWSDWLFGLI